MKSMAVITISRQLGSLGRDVANQVAERLGYRLVWRDMINEAARRASTPEVALATIDELDLLGLSPAPSARKAYRQAVQQVMEELAQAGNVVILGRAGQIVLRDYPHLVSVRIIAPLDVRARRVAQQQGITFDAAQSQVEASDRHRRDYLEKFYQAKWDDPALYDLVINTVHIAPSDAAEVVCHLVLSRTTDHADNPTGGTR
jgi:cytidylate kinase